MRQVTLRDFFDKYAGSACAENVNFLDIRTPYHRTEDAIVRYAPALYVL